jgi:hypothetical protein
MRVRCFGWRSIFSSRGRRILSAECRRTLPHSETAQATETSRCGPRMSVLNSALLARFSFGKSGCSTATRCPEREKSSAANCRLSEVVPDSILDALGWTEAGVAYGPAGERCALAQRRIRSKLDFALVASKSPRQKAGKEEVARVHFFGWSLRTYRNPADWEGRESFCPPQGR